MCSFDILHQSRTKKSTVVHTKIMMLITIPSEDDKQGCRRSFTLKCKHELITKIESRHSFLASFDEACRPFGINSRYYRWWKMQLDYVPDHVSPSTKKIHSGCPGLLVPLDDFLLRYVFELHEQGMVMTMWIVLKKSSNLCKIFVPNQIMQSCWLCTGGWRQRDWGTRWLLIILSSLLQR